MMRHNVSATQVDLAALHAQIGAHGYAVLHGVFAGLATGRAAMSLGDAIAPWDDGLMQELVPRAVSTPNTYSGIFGLSRFPHHTDLAHWQVPPRYLLLRCVRGFTDVPTLLLDGRRLLDRIGVDAMSRAIVSPRRLMAGKVQLLRLLERNAVGDVIRWDEIFLKPASRVGREVFREVQEMVQDAVPTQIVMTGDGDVLIVDNWRMLHGRPAIASNRVARKLERIYMRNLHEAHHPA